MVFYYIVAFTEIPGIRELRDTWVETAMTTADHQWLAERFFPQTVIDNIMSKQVTTDGIVTAPDATINVKHDDKPTNTDNGKVNDSGNAISISNPVEEITIKPGDKDELGNKILIYDKAQDIKIVEISGLSFKGRLLFVTDPSRVVVRHTSKKDAAGDFLSVYLNDYDGIAAINGNGFADENGVGSGGQILGWSMADGKMWGSKLPGAASAGFTKDNVLVVGSIDKPDSYNIRDMVQWGPALIANGDKLVSGSAGWGLHPRTAIGQTSDGTVILATVDGRQPEHSIGITVGELSDILYDYGCVNASLCDGGSSTVMMYDGEIIGSPSTPMKTTGRHLPNAIIVLKKQ
jgi:exopolysaccharide biosynthesis protein